MKKFIKNNSLSIVLILLFLISIAGQVKFGFEEHNRDLLEQGGKSLSLSKYLTSGHFIETTFENWESEFLQMAIYIVLTIFLQQKGSSESKDFEKKDPVDREPDPKRKGAPWPVKKGGLILTLYKYSLTIVFVILFIISFTLHFYGSWEDENQQLFLKSLPTKTAGEYFTDSRFWFESFQNWQSEFLSVFAIVVLSVFLRQKGSPQSKPVDAPNDQTGE